MSYLESEAIEILREVGATARNPVMLYSIGKDSSVLLHLARKAFFPARVPFPLLHIDTGWKFKAMYDHRDRIISKHRLRLITYKNCEGEAAGMSPFTHGSARFTDVMKTQALRRALDQYDFDVAVAGARRDEEKSRAKERIFSVRGRNHGWDPKAQRPELWASYNTHTRPGETMRVFPLSNWTESDIWQYILSEGIDIVPLYFAAERPVVVREGQLLMVDDDRFPVRDGEVVETRRVRFRTLGCWPLTAAIESNAATIAHVIAETAVALTSERCGRLIDSDGAGSMEQKKREGYF
ncbi:sulfate adenylyltransferase subunit CysD [Rhodopseudomonas sp. NSM]|uniref:sulfate adenylyltransferase subunit CysD n=1 Tax=Rhodopseudomonas sp. NSM TaxID=3457630 RepID=UPI0040355C76